MSTGGWLHSEQKKKGLEILREIGITDAVKVGISTAGNIKYTNPEGRIQIIQRSLYKTEVDEVREMMNPVPNLPVSTKKMKAQLVKQYVLNYEQEHWNEIRKIWQEIWGDYFIGYYFEEITEIMLMDFSDSVKTYLEMMVFAAKGNASLCHLLGH